MKRYDMIDALVEDVGNWSYSDLINYAREQYYYYLKDSDTEYVEKKYGELNEHVS